MKKESLLVGNKNRLELWHPKTYETRASQVDRERLNALAKMAELEGRIQCVGYPQWSLLKFRDAEGKDSLLVRSLAATQVAP